MPTATASFSIDATEPAALALTADEGVDSGHLVIRKTFQGDIDGSSSVEMLYTRTPDGAGGFAGAGYVALERIDGTVLGRRGSFMLLHLSAVTLEGEQTSSWPISPGSGTGDLAGIRGDGRIDIADDGAHTFTLEYVLP